MPKIGLGTSTTVNPPAPPPPGPEPLEKGSTPPLNPPGPPKDAVSKPPPTGLTLIVPLIVISLRDSKATGKGPSTAPLINWLETTSIESKSKTATPLETTPVKVPPGPIRSGVPCVSSVYVPGVVGKAPSELKSSGFSGPALAHLAAPNTTKASNATDWDSPDDPRLMRRPPL
jgi:hypothetical protein